MGDYIFKCETIGIKSAVFVCNGKRYVQCGSTAIWPDGRCQRCGNAVWSSGGCTALIPEEAARGQ